MRKERDDEIDGNSQEAMVLEMEKEHEEQEMMGNK
jgi:hypothetical protein